MMQDIKLILCIYAVAISILPLAIFIRDRKNRRQPTRTLDEYDDTSYFPAD